MVKIWTLWPTDERSSGEIAHLPEQLRGSLQDGRATDATHTELQPGRAETTPLSRSGGNLCISKIERALNFFQVKLIFRENDREKMFK